MDGETYNPEEFGIFGFGSERTLRDYEKYSGLLFSNLWSKSFIELRIGYFLIEQTRNFQFLFF